MRDLTTTDGVSSEGLAGIVGTGYGGVPHWRGYASAEYSAGPWVAYLEERFIGGGRYTTEFTINNDEVAEQLVLNGSLRYRFWARDGTRGHRLVLKSSPATCQAHRSPCRPLPAS